MRGSANIQHRPYLPPVFKNEKAAPYVCRLAPFADGFELEWLGDASLPHTLCLWEREKEEKIEIPVTDHVVLVDGLTRDKEYAFYVECEGGKRSRTRLVRTGELPDQTNVINYLHPQDGQYDFSGRFLCSPSIVQLPSGRMLCSMDLYGKEMPQNLMLLFYSDDDGESWRYLCDLYPFYWGSLFYYGDKLYVLGLSTEYGNLTIACSLDEGETWSKPTTLFYGSSVLCKYGGMHRSPMLPVAHNGRLWTSAEYGCWKCGSHLPAVLSIAEGDDLMVSENWTLSDFLPFDGEWMRASDGKQGDTMEGNLAVIDGELYNLMRYKKGQILKMRVHTDDPERAPEFCEILEAPVSNSMFRVVPDGDGFLLVTNRVTDAAWPQDAWSHRTVLSIFRTKNFRSFEWIRDVVNRENESANCVGFQYPCCIKRGNTLSIAIRSAFNQADTFHNSNYILFYKTEIETN